LVDAKLFLRYLKHSRNDYPISSHRNSRKTPEVYRNCDAFLVMSNSLLTAPLTAEAEYYAFHSLLNKMIVENFIE
jgi:hypothetical protein